MSGLREGGHGGWGSLTGGALVAGGLAEDGLLLKCQASPRD